MKAASHYLNKRFPVVLVNALLLLVRTFLVLASAVPGLANALLVLATVWNEQI